MRIDIYHHVVEPEDRVIAALARIETLVKTQGEKIMFDVTRLLADVAAETTIANSAIALIQGLKTQLDEALVNIVDPAARQALAQMAVTMEENQAKLAAAIQANTPGSVPTDAPTEPVVDPNTPPVDPNVP